MSRAPADPSAPIALRARAQTASAHLPALMGAGELLPPEVR